MNNGDHHSTCMFHKAARNMHHFFTNAGEAKLKPRQKMLHTQKATTA